MSFFMGFIFCIGIVCLSLGMLVVSLRKISNPSGTPWSLVAMFLAGVVGVVVPIIYLLR